VGSSQVSTPNENQVINQEYFMIRSKQFYKYLELHTQPIPVFPPQGFIPAQNMIGHHSQQ